MIRLALLLSLASAAVTLAGPPVTIARPVNSDDVRRQLGLLPEYAMVPRIGAVTVAVLDSGFAGAGGDRPYLPKSAVVVEHYDPAFIRRFNLGDPDYRKPLQPGDAHGRVMAQLVWAMAGNSPEGPRFLLLNANGPTLFRRAVRYAIEAKADVILFSGSFDGAGNYDGRGPINAAVDEAVAAGILWVNAAGNRGGMVANGPIVRGVDGYIRFPQAGGLTSLRFRNRFDENAVTVTLTWNDYREIEDAGTQKDLDLYIEDAHGNIVGKSELTQVPAGRPTREGETKNPRERVVLTDLPASVEGQEYRVRVKARSANFGPRDTLRILLTPAQDAPLTDRDTSKTVQAIEFLNATHGGEIYPPADHPDVLTVGDLSAASARGPTADGRPKPDVVLADSTARLSNGMESTGSSNAAAYFAGVLAVLKATEPRLTAGHVRMWGKVLDREGMMGQQPALSVPLVPPVMPLTPNQQRAFRYAEAAAAEQRAKGLSSPGVWVTSARGDSFVRPERNPTPAAPEARAPAMPLHSTWRSPSFRLFEELVRKPRG